MVDKIKPLKIESAVGGGTEINPFPVEADSTEDYASLKGVAFEGNDSRLIDLNASGNLQMTDFRGSAHVIPRTASEVDFNNSTNGFTAVQVQAAIEEAKSTAAGIARYTVTLIMNGVVSNGDWITYSELTPNTVILFPFFAQINEMTWANNNTGVSFDFEFYKNGTASGDKYRTYSVRNGSLTYGYDTGWTDSFNVGDYLKIKYVDFGTNCSDLVVNLFCRRTS